MSDILNAVQARCSKLPQGAGIERVWQAVKEGFRDVLGADGQPCLCGGLLKPYIENHDTIGIRCDNPACTVELVDDWRVSQFPECPRCGAVCAEVEPARYPEWAARKTFDRLLWCQTCELYVSERTTAIRGA